VKAISLWQPWASAIANGVKHIETRHWRTWHEGPIAIHAAKKRTRELRGVFNHLILEFGGFAGAFESPFDDLPFGAIVATANLLECVRTDMIAKSMLTREEIALGDYSRGRYAWILTDIKKLPTPVPATGHQGLFNVEL